MNNIVYLEEKEIGEIFGKIDIQIRKEQNKNEKKRLIRNKAMFALMYYCGLRVSETVMLQVDDYNPKKHEIYCHRIKSGISHEYKFYPDFAWVEKALKKHILINKPEKYLFTSSKKSDLPLSRKTCDVIFRDIMCDYRQDGSKNCNCNILRNSIAMHLIKRGAGIFDIQYWLGHAKIENTAAYFPNVYIENESCITTNERSFLEILEGEDANKKKKNKERITKEKN